MLQLESEDNLEVEIPSSSGDLSLFIPSTLESNLLYSKATDLNVNLI